MTSTGWLEGGGLSRNQAGRISSHGIPQNPGNGEADQSLRNHTDLASHPLEETQGDSEGTRDSDSAQSRRRLTTLPGLEAKGPRRTDRPSGSRRPLGALFCATSRKAEMAGGPRASDSGKARETWHTLILSRYQANAFPSGHTNDLQEDRAGTFHLLLNTVPAQGSVFMRDSMHSKGIPKSSNEALTEILTL